ncbi:MAG TPA: FAD-dependent oxidoreductase [Terriglobales bacterium]|nr:FAD-dependent oxidoreductase [Terriglobales bacterium]
MTRFDVAVIGAGPAGSAAAITAARLGARVLLLERGRYPRQKVCGEFVSAESLSLLRALLGDTRRDILDRATKISAARLFIGRRTVQIDVVPAAASITRLELDAALWAAAQKTGVETRSQTAVQSIRGAGPFAVITSSGEFEAAAVIDASGRWSNLRTYHSDQGSSAKWIGLKAHFFEAAPSGTVDLYFFEGGYCGVQPIEAAAVNACAMVRADVATTLREVFGQHPALRERSAAWEQIGEPVSTSPLVFSRPEPIRNGIACAGDAAGFVDPFIGDGISLALHSGVLAGESMAHGDFSSALGDYADEYSRRLLPVFRRSARLRRMLSLPHIVLGSILPLMKVEFVGRSVVSATRVRAAS